MVNIRENRKNILSVHDIGDLNDEEFIMLYDLNRILTFLIGTMIGLILIE